MCDLQLVAEAHATEIVVSPDPSPGPSSGASDAPVLAAAHLSSVIFTSRMTGDTTGVSMALSPM